MTHIMRIDEMAVRFADSIDNKVDFAAKQNVTGLNNVKNEIKRILKSLPVNDMVDVIDTYNYAKQKGYASRFEYNNIKINKYGYIVSLLVHKSWDYDCALIFNKDDFYLCTYKKDSSYGLPDITEASNINVDELVKEKCTINNIIKDVKQPTGERIPEPSTPYVEFLAFYSGNLNRKSKQIIEADLILKGLREFSRNIGGFIDEFFDKIQN